MEEKVSAIVDWLQMQVSEANVKGLIVGVSGGLDSAVVANLMYRAFPEDSLGVIMPLKSNPIDVKDAEEVVKTCGIKHMTTDLTASHTVLYDEITKQLKANNNWNEAADRIADANLRARLRMGTLYTLATHLNYLVVGTDNLSEWHTGYFTKYGDGGVDILPIVDLTKTEVYEMATYLDVPKSVIEKQPSADLWVGQTDEEEMGTTYAKIDAYLKGETIPTHDQHLIDRMHQQTAHKRKTPTKFRFK